MDDQYTISTAKTVFRDGMNAGDVDRVLSVFCDGFTDMSDGQPSFFFGDARMALRTRLEELFRDYQVEIAPVIIDIAVLGDLAFDFGWHKVWLTAKKDQAKKYQKFRYFELWQRQPDGGWKIMLWMTNREHAPRLEPLSEAAALGAVTPSSRARAAAR
jgi:ketosteroid isomerase-like protein